MPHYGFTWLGCSAILLVRLVHKAEELRNIPNRVCLAGGKEKLAAILATLRGGFAADLVIDLPTAEMLIGAAEK